MLIHNNFNRLMILFIYIKLKKVIKYEVRRYYVINIDLQNLTWRFIKDFKLLLIEKFIAIVITFILKCNAIIAFIIKSKIVYFIEIIIYDFEINLMSALINAIKLFFNL